MTTPALRQHDGSVGRHRPAPRAAVGAARFVLVSACTASLGSVGCRPAESVSPPAPVVTIAPALPPAAAPAAQLPQVRFVDVTESAGIRFRHVNGAMGKRLLPETMGSGAAFLDYDNDGDPDLLLVNSCYWPGFAPADQPAPTLAFYRNRGDGAFDDVTTAAGLAITMYGLGATAGDYDNDGWIDLFVTGVGGNRLFANVADDQGGRRFEDRTAAAGVGGPGGWPEAVGEQFLAVSAPINFSSSAAFLDYDNDARLDLFVCNYITWSPAVDLGQGFQLVGLGRGYGPPTAFEGVQCVLYHNRGDGHFEDVSQPAGIHVQGPLQQAIGKSLGVIVFDPDGDGWLDLAVANDTVRNFLFHNTGHGTFEEIGELAGLAYAEGRARGAMGIDWGEYRPGSAAVFVGNFADEPNTFLRLDDPRQLLFSDVATAEGVAGPSRLPLKFSALFLDYDLDGWQDLFTCNGHLEPEIHQVQSRQTYRQAPQLFWNCGGVGEQERRGCFVTVDEPTGGADLFRPQVGRGCAYADIDADGDLDLVLTENGGPARLLRNEGGNANHWLRIALRGDGQRCSTSAIGARLTLAAGGRTMIRELTSARGYLSQSESVVTFGLGDTAKIDRLTIRWPGPQGGEQQLTDLAVDRLHVLSP